MNQNCGYGKCLSTGTCASTCVCDPGYNGTNCEQKLDICLSNPCLNNGVCASNNNDRWTCQCAPGFTGPRCSVALIACSSNPCENDGFCVEKSGSYGYSCICASGWTGASCEVDINEVTMSFKYEYLVRILLILNYISSVMPSHVRTVDCALK